MAFQSKKPDKWGSMTVPRPRAFPATRAERDKASFEKGNKAWETVADIRSGADLQAIHDARSLRSRESDERQSNADTIEPDDPRVEQWIKDQGRLDVVGIDTPRKGKSRKPVRRSRRAGKVEAQVRGVRR